MFSMGKLTLREAAKMFDVSRPTLTKALKSGKITGEPVYRDGPGTPVTEWRVDQAELNRVYRPRSANEQVDIAANLSTLNRGLPDKVEAELSALRERVIEAEKRAAVAEALAEERAGRIEDLRRMLPSFGSAQVPRKAWWKFGN
jgi:hypothetical protein